jgi:Delta24-sterol reductase
LRLLPPRGRADAADRLTGLLIRYRWLFVVPVLLPLSALFDLVFALRRVCLDRLLRSPERHDARVAQIQAQIQGWRATGAPGRLCTARRNWTNVSARLAGYKRPENSIRIELHDILALDPDRRLVRVEPRVTVGRLLDHLLPRGWTLAVVPELNDLTIGGLFLGYGIETSSHRHGLLCDLVRSCDVVLGDGRLVRASAEQNRDLFHALPWSMGSLGFVVALELSIVPARPYVHLTYHPVRSSAEACALFEHEACRADAADFVEAILYARDAGLVITGVFADAAEPGKIYAAHRWHQPWFAHRCRQFVDSGGHDEYLPLAHYYRRHERGMFWESELIVSFGNHPLFRWLLGWLMPPKVAFLRLTQGERIRRYYDEQHVLQDALVPMRHLAATLACFERIFDGWPIWLCPMRVNRQEPQGAIGPADDAGDHEMYVDVGVFTVPGPVLRGEPYNALDATRSMEKFLLEHRGYQALYAVTQLSREEFRRMFDRTLYDRVRRDYGADGALMDVYDKVKPAGIN